MRVINYDTNQTDTSLIGRANNSQEVRLGQLAESPAQRELIPRRISQNANEISEKKTDLNSNRNLKIIKLKFLTSFLT